MISTTVLWSFSDLVVQYSVDAYLVFLPDHIVSKVISKKSWFSLLSASSSRSRCIACRSVVSNCSWSFTDRGVHNSALTSSTRSYSQYGAVSRTNLSWLSFSSVSPSSKYRCLAFWSVVCNCFLTLPWWMGTEFVIGFVKNYALPSFTRSHSQYGAVNWTNFRFYRLIVKF